MSTPDYALHRYGSDDGSWGYLVAYPSVGSPWITERPTPGRAMTVHQATVLFGAVAENTIALGFESAETGQGTVLVKLEGTREWLAPTGYAVSLEEFIRLLNLCNVRV